jgi:hypothetical protein
MSYIFDSLDAILNENPDDFVAVRVLLRDTKDIHNDVKTKDLNERYNIPGFRFIKRGNVLQLIRDGTSAGREVTDFEGSDVANGRPAYWGTVARTPLIKDSQEEEQHFSRQNPRQDLSSNTQVSEPVHNTLSLNANATSAMINALNGTRPAISSDPVDPTLDDQVQMAAKVAAKQYGQKRAEEHEKVVSKRLRDALNSVVNTEAEQEPSQSLRDESKMRAEIEQKLREEFRMYEQKLREEKQHEEKLEREAEQRNRVEHRPTVGEMIQSLALEQAQMKAQTQAQKEAQLLTQTIAHALCGGDTKKECDIVPVQIYELLHRLLDEVNEIKYMIAQKFEDIDEKIESIEEKMEEESEMIEQIYTRNYIRHHEITDAEYSDPNQ